MRQTCVVVCLITITTRAGPRRLLSLASGNPVSFSGGDYIDNERDYWGWREREGTGPCARGVSYMASRDADVTSTATDTNAG